MEAQRGGREDRAFAAVGGPVAEHGARRPAGLAIELVVVREVLVEKALDLLGEERRDRTARSAAV